MKDYINSNTLTLSKTLIATLTILLLTGLGTAEDLKVTGTDTEDSYASIQNAIDKAQPEDTLILEKGTYEVTEEINVSKSVTIKSAGDGRPVINNTASGWTALMVTAENVTLDGLKVVNLNNDDDERIRGIHGDRDSDRLVIKDTVVDGVDGQTNGETAYGMTLQGNSTEVINSEVEDVEGTDFAAGIRLGGNSQYKIKNGRIENVDISSIEAVGKGPASAGILLASVSSSEQTKLLDNSVSDLAPSENSAAVSFGSTNSDATNPTLIIKDNDLSAGVAALNIEDSQLTSLSNVDVSENDFSGVVVANRDEDTNLDVSENYWGQAPRPANKRIYGTIDLESWYATSDYSQDVKVVSSGDTVAYSGTIQAAVDAASSGDKLNVSAGTFDESVSIGKQNVSLVGSGEETVIDGRIDIPVDGVAVENLTVRNGAKSGSGEVEGIFVGNANGFDNISEDIAIRDVTVEDIRPHGTTKTVEGIQIKNYDKGDSINGVTISEVEIRNIMQTGAGADGIKLQAGVQDVSVTDSTIEDIRGRWAYGAVATPSSTESGVPENVLVRSNTISNVTATKYKGVGVGIDGGNGNGFANPDEITVSGNGFERNDIAVLNKNSDESLNAVRNYWGQDYGPDESQVLGNVHFAPWKLTESGDYDRLVHVEEGYTPVSPTQQLSETPAVGTNGAASFQSFSGFDSSDWENSATQSPLESFYVNVEGDDATVGFKHASGSDNAQNVDSVSLEEGWNTVGVASDGDAKDRFSVLEGPLRSLYVPTQYSESSDFNTGEILSTGDLSGNETRDELGYWVNLAEGEEYSVITN
ncbi:MAG: hypothetical protein BRC29_01480 [Nanohaloarchaea archaeon SW_7_43_1]|nr:MAG: hypothetical protein BRC29_01480 [Nanohaloarchaea archaeon SW_7_43_1]